MPNLAVLYGSVEANADGLIRTMDRASLASEKAARRSEGAWRASSRAQTEAVVEASRRIEESYKRIEMMSDRLTGTIRGGLTAAFATLGVTGVGSIVKMTDEIRQLEQRVRMFTKQTGDGARVFDELYKTSQKVGVSIGSSVETFTRLSMSADRLGATNKDILKVVDTVQKLGAIGGSSTTSMQYGLQQFGQALGGTIMRMEEFNSLNENIPLVLDRIAKGMGLSFGELQSMVREGRILSKDVMAALLTQAEATNKEFSLMSISVERATQAAQNAVARMFGTIDEGLGITRNISSSLSGWAEDIDKARMALDGFFKLQIRLDKMGKISVPEDRPDLMRPGKFNRTWYEQDAPVGSDMFDIGTALSAAGRAGVGFGAKVAGAPLQDMPGLIMGAPGTLMNDLFDQAAREKKIREGIAKAQELVVAGGAPINPTLQDGSKGSKRDTDKTDDLEKMIKGLQTQAEVQQLIAQGRKTEAEVLEEISRIEAQLGVSLIGRGKEAVRQAVIARENAKSQIEMNKENAAAQEKAFKELVKQQETYQKINTELRSRIAGVAEDAAQNKFQVEINKERLRVEERITKLTEEQKNNIRAIFEEYAAGKRAGGVQDAFNKITGGRTAQEQEEDLYLDPKTRERTQAARKMLDDLASRGATDEELGQAARMFDEQDARDRKKAFQDHLHDVAKTTEAMRHQQLQLNAIAEGNEYIAELDKEILAAEEKKGEALTEQERKLIEIQVAYQQQYRDINKARGIIEQQKSAQEKYNDLVRQLTPLLNQGLLTQQQFNKALWQAHPQYEKIKATAQDIGNAFSSAFQKSIMGGEKFTDVMKNLGKELAAILAKRLLFDPLANGITNLVQRGAAAAAGLPYGGAGSGAGPGVPIPAWPWTPTNPQPFGGQAPWYMQGSQTQPPGGYTPYPYGYGVPFPGGGVTGGWPGVQVPGGGYNPYGSGNAWPGYGQGAQGQPPVFPFTDPTLWTAPGGNYSQSAYGYGGGGGNSLGGAMHGGASKGASSTGNSLGGGAADYAGMSPYQLGQMRDQAMRDGAQRMLMDPNATMLEKSIATYAQRGLGTPVNWGHYVAPGAGWNVGGGAAPIMFGGGGDDGGPTTQEQNIARERALQESRWASDRAGAMAQGIYSGAGGNRLAQGTAGASQYWNGATNVPGWTDHNKWKDIYGRTWDTLPKAQHSEYWEASQGSLAQFMNDPARMSPFVGGAPDPLFNFYGNNPNAGQFKYPPGIGPSQDAMYQTPEAWEAAQILQGQINMLARGYQFPKNTIPGFPSGMMNPTGVMPPSVGYPQLSPGLHTMSGGAPIMQMSAFNGRHVPFQMNLGMLDPIAQQLWLGSQRGTVRGFAKGGRPSIGELVRVNEEGPNRQEFFKPDVGGRVIPLGDMPLAPSGTEGGGYGQVQVHNYTGMNVQTQQTGGGGGRKLNVYIGREIAKDINRGGPVGQAVNNSTGSRRKPSTKR